MIEVVAPDGFPEVAPGDDLATLLLARVDLADGDVVLVTSKAVSKAEGRLRPALEREAALAAESERVVARRGPTTIVRHRLGLVMAAAGIDASNVDPDTIALLPLDPDASSRRLRTDLLARAAVNVGVLVTDTFGRPWRVGQTDVAIGAAGVVVLEDLHGRTDPHGRPLVVTAPAVADELAGAAELAKGKLGRRPVAVVRGRPDLVLPAGEHGPGAAALVRPEQGDLFGLGSREAVVAALRGEDPTGFGSPVDVPGLLDALARAFPDARSSVGADAVVTVRGASYDGVRAVAFAHGWSADPGGRSDVRLRISRGTP